MESLNTAIKNLGDTVVSAAGSVAGAVADPKGGLKQLKSAMSSPKALAAAAGLVAGYALGWWCGHRAATR
ncbi:MULTISPECIES: hypothetical protein [Microbispora]|uniref:DUF3618 domain-containing protein n=3 Tax=Microbispora TaxID=2005 RepID=A0ABY3LT65_9ACTN|nr:MULTISPECIES: hypothetical protein [Microbispora]RGA02636.1 hypothetical protein DI270_023340 [Microbispora triticiradicis]TLP60942.1 hypothetical protein FED44_13985 [Microbispora fusca]TYB53060.1 hypothetical protein FXF59_24040 [Microbispora tritici]GLW26020.1 hypothetical protein Mame01_60620 [Microbispora amethystogenes]